MTYFKHLYLHSTFLLVVEWLNTKVKHFHALGVSGSTDRLYSQQEEDKGVFLRSGRTWAVCVHVWSHRGSARWRLPTLGLAVFSFSTPWIPFRLLLFLQLPLSLSLSLSLSLPLPLPLSLSLSQLRTSQWLYKTAYSRTPSPKFRCALGRDSRKSRRKRRRRRRSKFGVSLRRFL